MKCVLGKEALLNVLTQVQSVVSSRTTLPILNNALVRAENGQVTISTTDLDTGIRAVVDAVVELPGGTTIPARRLLSIVRELPGSELELELTEKNYTCIRSGQAFFRVVGLPEEEFPPFPKMETARSYQLPQGVFKDLLKLVSYAISMDESRYVLNGVLMSFRENKLTLVATDGRRLALVQHDYELTAEQAADVIIPTKTVNELQRILATEGNLTVSLGENQIAFDLGRTYLVSKLIEGNYPNYRQVIPADAKERIILDREHFLGAIRRVSLLSAEKSSSVRLSFTNNNLEITANTPEVGDARESIPILYQGKAFTMAFSPEFLQDPLKNIDSSEIFFDFIDELSPGVIKYHRPFLYVIMPIRSAH